MRALIVVTSIICLSLIALGAYLASGNGGGEPRLVPMHRGYEERVARGGWLNGDVRAPVKIVEYADYQCPYCRTFSFNLSQALAQVGSTASLEYRHFPLYAIHGRAELAARGAEAAGRQGKFWEMHSLIYSRQLDWSNKESAAFERDLITYARDTLRINVEQFKRDLDDGTLTTPIVADVKAGSDQGVTGTPTIFINGKAVEPIPETTEAIVQLIRTAAASQSSQ